MRNKLIGIGSVFTAILASLCCIGPAVLAVLGASGLGFLTIFEPYRPYLIATTALLLSAGFYLTYRKKEMLCEDGSCQVKSAGKWNKIALWFATVVAVFFLSYPYLNTSFLQSAPGNAQNNLANLHQIIIPVQGMTCTGCESHVESVVSSLNGVVEVKANFSKSQAFVKIDSTLIAVDDVIEAINLKTNYQAKIISE